MAFSDRLIQKVRKQAHFCCCLCHSLWVEVHHIIPQADGGPDTEENAAPLCPSCHEAYGGNPAKRKFIREVRDFWYEICAKRYSSDPQHLTALTEALKDVATTDDIRRLSVQNSPYVLG